MQLELGAFCLNLQYLLREWLRRPWFMPPYHPPFFLIVFKVHFSFRCVSVLHEFCLQFRFSSFTQPYYKPDHMNTTIKS